MQIIAVIPARGGSKGIKDKNIVPVGGVPLIARTIKAVKSCELIDTIVVSTDSEKIAKIAHQCGAEVVDRPAELSGDKVSSEAAVIHACNTMSLESSKKYDIVLLVQNTSPFHDPDDMKKIIEMVSTGKFNSAITTVETHKYYWRETADGIELSFQKRARRQLRDALFEEAGSLYCVKYEKFISEGNLFAEPVGTVNIPWWRGMEIDNPEDLELVELLCQKYDTIDKE